MKRHLWWIVCLAAVLVAPISFAEEGHVHARLVADAAELQGGESFLLGVLLEPDPGWHVYWRDPGEAGLATEIAYDLPEGFEVGELQWPVPVSFDQPGGIAGFGYEEPVVLAAQITVPKRIPAATPVTLSASWLACKDVCILGSTELKADLPLRGSKLEASKTALETWPGTLPTQAAPGPMDISVNGGPVPDSGSVDLVVWLNWTEAPGTVEFFPDPGPGLKVEGVHTQTRDLLTRIDFTISRLKTSNAPATSLRSLIVIEDLRGNRSAKISHISID